MNRKEVESAWRDYFSFIKETLSLVFKPLRRIDWIKWFGIGLLIMGVWTMINGVIKKDGFMLLQGQIYFLWASIYGLLGINGLQNKINSLQSDWTRSNSDAILMLMDKALVIAKKLKISNKK